MATSTMWNRESSCSNYVIHILQEVGAELKHLFKTSLPYAQLHTSGLSGLHLKFTNPARIVDTNRFKTCLCLYIKKGCPSISYNSIFVQILTYIFNRFKMHNKIMINSNKKTYQPYFSQIINYSAQLCRT